MSRLRRLIQASVDATKRALSGNLDDLMPPPERPIFSFNSKKELSKWHLYSDSEFGGLSSASLQITESENGVTSGIFSGNLSLDVTEGSKWNITRGGFCGMRSKKFDGFIDLDSYDTIAMKLKGDGRCYISTIYTENWVNSPGQMEDNSWQAFVYVPEGNWYITKVLYMVNLCLWLHNQSHAPIKEGCVDPLHPT
ncbi:probable complex I intermediate-associated protein 30 isoform X2 [Vigna unguiculata]|uniref:probable complex I intermediate-associated protein 30 isoform X2 n=1 Tax=Vigna unguiculata TaxID=3917 RepID=UPI001016693C|nr:probable complex I intermediate-associated protein 30 isoform X2 [Vigna unguiculata]